MNPSMRPKPAVGVPTPESKRKVRAALAGLGKIETVDYSIFITDSMLDEERGPDGLKSLVIERLRNVGVAYAILQNTVRNGYQEVMVRVK